MNKEPDMTCECDGDGRIWNNADKTSGQWFACECADDPKFDTRDEMRAWAMQRMRFPDPSKDARLAALEHIRRVVVAHEHLMAEENLA